MLISLPVMSKTIILAGDSHLADNPELQGHNYHSTQMIADGTNADVINVAVGGFKTWQLLDQVQTFLDSGGEFKPETTVIIDIGLPDFYVDTSPREIYCNLDQVITLLEDNNVRVILSGSPEAHNNSEIGQQDNISYLYYRLQDNHPGLEVVNIMAELLPQSQYHDDDPIHLNGYGYFQFNLKLIEVYNHE